MTRPASRGWITRAELETLESRMMLDAALVSSVLSAPSNPATILVQFKDGASPHALPGSQLGRTFDLVPGLYEVRLDSATSAQNAIAAYARDAAVSYAAPDYTVSPSWVPNDPQFSQQYHLRNTAQTGGTKGADIKAEPAWGVGTGTMRTTVAVFDTGIDYTHPDLYKNIWLNQGEIPASRRANLIDTDNDKLITFRDLNDPRNIGPGKITDLNGNGYIDAGDVLKPMTINASLKDTGAGGWANGQSDEGDRYVDDLIGWNFFANNNNPMDDFGHGTHVAGTLGADGNNGTGVTGVAWKVSIAAIRFTDNRGYGSLTGIIAGLDYAVAKGIKISNHSWEAAGQIPGLQQAMERARAAGLIIVAAAGNGGKNTDVSPVYPSGFPLDNVVSVGATTKTDALAGFSNYGRTTVDIAAPGDSILSTNPGKAYGYRSGTSMATPQVTAAIALVWGLRPEWTYKQVIAWVLSTADRTTALNGKVASGRLNLQAALRIPARPFAPIAPAGVAQVLPVPTAVGAKVTSVAVAAPASFPTRTVVIGLVSEAVPAVARPAANVLIDAVFSGTAAAPRPKDKRTNG